MAGAETPSRLVTFVPSRSSLVTNKPRTPRDVMLWWICSAKVLFPEPIVPKLNRSVAIAQTKLLPSMPIAPLPQPAGMSRAKAQVAAMIDHTLLSPTMRLFSPVLQQYEAGALRKVEPRISQVGWWVT